MDLGCLFWLNRVWGGGICRHLGLENESQQTSGTLARQPFNLIECLPKNSNDSCHFYSDSRQMNALQSLKKKHSENNAAMSNWHKINCSKKHPVVGDIHYVAQKQPP